MKLLWTYAWSKSSVADLDMRQNQYKSEKNN